MYCYTFVDIHGAECTCRRANKYQSHQLFLHSSTNPRGQQLRAQDSFFLNIYSDWYLSRNGVAEIQGRCGSMVEFQVALTSCLQYEGGGLFLSHEGILLKILGVG